MVNNNLSSLKVALSDELLIATNDTLLIQFNIAKQ